MLNRVHQVSDNVVHYFLCAFVMDNYLCVHMSKWYLHISLLDCHA